MMPYFVVFKFIARLMIIYQILNIVLWLLMDVFGTGGSSGRAWRVCVRALRG